MNDEIVPKDGAGWIDNLNLPRVLAGPAGEALARLVGNVADIPSEYLENIAQGIRDKREARTAVSKALSKAVSDKIATDERLVERAMQSYLARELRSQVNKEEIAKKAIEHLAETSSTDDKSEAPDDDWMNIFEQYAANASSEKLRELWARILAKQIRLPRTFSLRTIRFVSELDADTARLFEKYAPRVANGEFLAKPTPLEGTIFMELMSLEHAGLLAGVDGSMSRTYRTDARQIGRIQLSFAHFVLYAEHEGPLNFVLPMILLTDVGKEILSILTVSDGPDAVSDAVAHFPKGAGFKKVSYAKVTGKGNDVPIVVWEETNSPTDPANR
jgi:hypothetical protein